MAADMVIVSLGSEEDTEMVGSVEEAVCSVVVAGSGEWAEAVWVWDCRFLVGWLVVSSSVKRWTEALAMAEATLEEAISVAASKNHFSFLSF